MAKQIKLTETKTYATEANAIKAVEKIYGDDNSDGLRYIVIRTESGRFYPAFINAEKACQAGVHFNFHVLG